MRSVSLATMVLLALGACGSEPEQATPDIGLAQPGADTGSHPAGDTGSIAAHADAGARLDGSEVEQKDTGGTTSADAGETAHDAAMPGSDAACTPPAFQQPEVTGPAPALIVTNVALKPVFDRLAALHTVTGIPTEVTTIEEICPAGACVDSDPKRDTIKAIKDHLKARTGLKYVVLGGGIDVIPSRKVHDSYSNPLMPSYNFDADFVTDYYYSDFTEWDTNGDGVYADKGVDVPGYRPAVPVSRIPVHTLVEAQTYLDKVVHHLTAYDPAAVKNALAVTNIAAQYSGMNIDSALYLQAAGRTLSLLPQDFTVSKLYATASLDPTVGKYSAAGVISALEAGQNLVVHSGHAGPDVVTVEIDGSEPFLGTAAYALTNTSLPFFLSCGCEAGDYSTAYNAGEQLVLAPSGGAIAYLGNAPIGLGIAGGMQMIDELLRYVQANDLPLLGDAYFAAHQNLPTADTFKIVVNVPVMNQDSYQWTQKAVVLFGDLLIPAWKAARPASPTLTAKKTPVCQGSTLELTFSGAVTGTLQVLADGALYEVMLTGHFSATLTLAGDPKSITVGLSSGDTQYGFWELTL